MKVDRPKIQNTTESTSSDAAASSSEALQPAKSPSPKTDTVEVKTNSFYNFDQAKLDPSKTDISGTDPVAFIPPFREKVEIAKTLPDGQPVDSGLPADITGKTYSGPNHHGINMDGINVRNQLNDALKLREGSNNPSPSGSETYQPVTAMDIGTHGNTAIPQGLNAKHGMDQVAAEKDTRGPGQRIVDTVVDAAKNLAESVKNITVKDVVDAVPKAIDKVVEYGRDVGVQKFGPPLAGEAVQLLDAPGKVKEVTGDEKDLVRGIAATVYPENRLNRLEGQIQEKQYVNPEADGGQTQITDELMKKVLIREGANTTPANVDTPADEIDGSELTAPGQFDNPKLQMVINPQVEDQSAFTPASLESIDVRKDATGPDTVNPENLETDDSKPRP